MIFITSIVFAVILLFMFILNFRHSTNLDIGVDYFAEIPSVFYLFLGIFLGVILWLLFFYAISRYISTIEKVNLKRLRYQKDVIAKRMRQERRTELKKIQEEKKKIQQTDSKLEVQDQTTLDISENQDAP